MVTKHFNRRILVEEFIGGRQVFQSNVFHHRNAWRPLGVEVLCWSFKKRKVFLHPNFFLQNGWVGE